MSINNKIKKRKRRKGIHPSTEFKVGHKHSPVVLEKLRKTWFKKGEHISPATEFKKGHKNSEITKMKMRLAHLGIKRAPFTYIHKQKIKEARLKRIIPFKDTSIELKLQSFCKELNIPFETHKVIENFVQCDLFIAPNICIFADGCYWHACPICFPDRTKLNKLPTKNLLRDIMVNEYFNKHGDKLKVIRLWEHQIRFMCLEEFEKKLIEVGVKTNEFRIRA